MLANDALYLQSQVRHGSRKPMTTDIEADESVFFKWKVVHDIADPDKTEYSKNLNSFGVP